MVYLKYKLNKACGDAKPSMSPLIEYNVEVSVNCEFKGRSY